MKKKILVTGGIGFLGTNLILNLIKDKNVNIICVDNFQTSFSKNLNLLKNYKNFKFIKHDIIKKINIKVDEIYHLACAASPPHYQKDPIHTLKTNFMGSLNLLNLSKKNKSKILLSSTSEVYGDPLCSPQKEIYLGNVNPIGIRGCYDEGKRVAETLFMDFRRQYKTKIKIARIFNTYGPYMNPNDGRVVSNFIIKCLKNENIEIYGNGNQTRSFCYVDDLINGLIKLMKSKSSFTGPVNIGNISELRVIDLAQKIKNITGSKSRIINKPLPMDDPKIRKPDIELAKKELNWSPQIKLNDGLEKTIKYFDSII
jgi:UDP-glucuronate decarboxylase